MRAYSEEHEYTVEIEVRDLEEAIRAAKAIHKYRPKGRIAMIMLDNTDSVTTASIIDELKKQGLYEDILYEASGGKNLKNVIAYVGTGVDVISSSDLTCGCKEVDIHKASNNNI